MPFDLLSRVGNKRGHFKDKANRIAKLIDSWQGLERKMEDMVVRGSGVTHNARLAYATLLMMETGIRTGNESSAEGWICENQIVCRKANKEKGLKVGDIIWRHPLYGKHVRTYGLTTLLHRHVKLKKDILRIEFVGKKLVDQSLRTSNAVLVKYRPIEDPEELPGGLFLGISYHELKKFVKRHIGRQYTPKDLRMAKANLIFLDKFKDAVEGFLEQTTKSGRKKVLSEVIEETANVIGHTKSVCRSSYLSQPLVEFLATYQGSE